MDSILYWNDVALEANRVSHTNGRQEQTGPTLSSRALAIVHLAMYDAFAGVARKPGLPPYLRKWPEAPATSPEASAAAVAAAAHATLSDLFPGQKAFFDAKHRQAGLSGDPAKLQAGHTFGLVVARAILEDRKDDPTASDKGYAAAVQHGAHRPDPDNPGQGFHGPFYGNAKPFAVTDLHELKSPPPFDSDDYCRALRQVYAKGIAPELMGTLPAGAPQRTNEETLIGLYWAYDGPAEIGTPPRLYNQIVRKVAEGRNSEADNARLFAFVNAAMADAGILAWREKYRHDLWRPVLGIREHDPSMGPAGVPGGGGPDPCAEGGLTAWDIGWLPLGAPSTNSLNQDFTPGTHQYPCAHARVGQVKNFTPPFPAYPSGHATFGAAAFQITRLFYGQGKHGPDDLFEDLAFVSEELDGVNKDNKGTVRPRHVRSFPDGLWQMIVENGMSRVFLGVHWVFDAFLVDEDGQPRLGENVGGVPLGLKIAEDIFAAGDEKAPRNPHC